MSFDPLVSVGDEEYTCLSAEHRTAYLGDTQSTCVCNRGNNRVHQYIPRDFHDVNKYRVDLHGDHNELPPGHHPGRVKNLPEVLAAATPSSSGECISTVVPLQA